MTASPARGGSSRPSTASATATRGSGYVDPVYPDVDEVVLSRIRMAYRRAGWTEMTGEQVQGHPHCVLFRPPHDDDERYVSATLLPIDTWGRDTGGLAHRAVKHLFEQSASSQERMFSQLDWLESRDVR